jgi:CRP-like cAMP-binding protein
MLVLHFVYHEPIGPVIATSGAAAIVVGFGAQSTIREVFSGFSLNATKALRIGDYVEIDDVYGQVYDINWRSVSLHNPHTDSLYIFPNSAVAGKKILNFSEPKDVFRYYVTFTAELSAPPEKVIRSIAEELKQSKYVYRDPAPDFNILGYNENGIEYRIRYHFEGDDPWWDAQNELCMAIWSAARRNNFRIAMNRMLNSSPQEWPHIDEQVETATNAESVLSMVKAHPVFADLSEDQTDELCRSYKSIDLSPPSCFYLPGDQNPGLYLLVEGEVGIVETFEDEHQLEIATCHPGELFGVEAVHTKVPAAKMSRAEQYSIAVCFDPDVVRELVKHHPGLDQNLKDLIDQNNKERAVRRDEETRKVLIKNHAKTRLSSLGGIRRGVDDMLNLPVTHHVLDHFSRRVRNEELVEGLAAAAALLAVARGVPQDNERESFKEVLMHADLLRHVDLEHALLRFDEYAVLLLEGSDKNTAHVRECLQEAARVPHGAKIVGQAATALAGIGGLPNEEEIAALDVVKDALGKVVRSK